MLKQKLNKDDVVVFRTVGSDEVIATLIEETDTAYRVSKPLALAMTAKGVGMTQYMIMADKESEFEFLKTTLITVGKANSQAKEAYAQSISNIVQPPKQSIIT
tara:strand:+ start:3576 stop:3884 length:309 start_codon:yes stop_codon:yes gene_type:complete